MTQNMLTRMKNIRLTLPTAISYIIVLLSVTVQATTISTDSLKTESAEPPKFIPLRIDKPFLHDLQMAAADQSAKTGEISYYIVPGEIDNLYIKDKSHIAVKVMNKDIFRGKLVCASKFGIYVYSNEENGIVYCPYESVEWIRRGKSYGNWLWKSGIGYSILWAYVFGEQSFAATTQAIFSGGTTAVTIGQLLAAPIYSARLRYPEIKFKIDFNRKNGEKYYEMVKSNFPQYSNAVDFESFPGFLPN